MLQFILERYNYWIVIILMMTGLYIVFSRGNLVKKIIGLNIFQTSVFIFYITIGKITGGTAPIILGGHGEGEHGGDEGHGGDNGHAGQGSHGGTQNHSDDVKTGHVTQPDGVDANRQSGIETVEGDLHAAIGSTQESLHGKIANQFPDIEKNRVIDLNDKAQSNETSLHDVDGLVDKISNSALKDAKAALLDGRNASTTGSDVEALANDLVTEHLSKAEKTHTSDAHISDGNSGDGVLDAAGIVHTSAGEVIYTNPLPHVLILTAIVVGVATTAVGLALAVRIREAYGTIEEDELEALDDIAEFGEERSFTAKSVTQGAG